MPPVLFKVHLFWKRGKNITSFGDIRLLVRRLLYLLQSLDGRKEQRQFSQQQRFSTQHCQKLKTHGYQNHSHRCYAKHHHLHHVVSSAMPRLDWNDQKPTLNSIQRIIKKMVWFSHLCLTFSPNLAYLISIHAYWTRSPFSPILKIANRRFRKWRRSSLEVSRFYI